MHGTVRHKDCESYLEAEESARSNKRWTVLLCLENQTFLTFSAPATCFLGVTSRLNAATVNITNLFAPTEECVGAYQWKLRSQFAFNKWTR